MSPLCRHSEVRAGLHHRPCRHVAPTQGRRHHRREEEIRLLRNPDHRQRSHGGQTGRPRHAARRRLPHKVRVRHAGVTGECLHLIYLCNRENNVRGRRCTSVLPPSVKEDTFTFLLYIYIVNHMGLDIIRENIADVFTW